MSLISWLAGEPETPVIKQTTIGLLAQSILKDLSLYQLGTWEVSERGTTTNMREGHLYQVFNNTKRNYTLSTQLSDFSEKRVNIDEIHINPLTRYEQALIFDELVKLSQRLKELKNAELKKVDDAFLQKTFPENYPRKTVAPRTIRGVGRYYG